MKIITDRGKFDVPAAGGVDTRRIYGVPHPCEYPADRSVVAAVVIGVVAAAVLAYFSSNAIRAWRKRVEAARQQATQSRRANSAQSQTPQNRQ